MNLQSGVVGSNRPTEHVR